MAKYDNGGDNADFRSTDWGKWWVLHHEPGSFKVKKLLINKDKAISRQFHNHRTETWNIITGEGVLETGYPDLLTKMHIVAGDTFTIRKGEVHKVLNTGSEDMIAIEVQIGPITEETDIIRI